MPFINYMAPAIAGLGRDEKARRRNLGISGMKTLGGQGQLADEYDTAFRYVLGATGRGVRAYRSSQQGGSAAHEGGA